MTRVPNRQANVQKGRPLAIKVAHWCKSRITNFSISRRQGVHIDASRKCQGRPHVPPLDGPKCECHYWKEYTTKKRTNKVHWIKPNARVPHLDEIFWSHIYYLGKTPQSWKKFKSMTPQNRTRTFWCYITLGTQWNQIILFCTVYHKAVDWRCQCSVVALMSCECLWA